MHKGQELMGDYETTQQLSTLRPFICVGISYFVIAVLFPLFVLRTKGETGHWTMGGFVWSFAAGAAGALGALGIILAFKFRGSPVYVMPLVFGCAPVVNTFVTMFMAKSFRQASMIFYLGVLTVAIGAAGVLVFKPSPKEQSAPSVAETYRDIKVSESADGKINVSAADDSGPREWGFSSKEQLREDETAYALFKIHEARKRQPTFAHIIMIVLSIGLTASCWGSYGPVLHKGQMKMAGSRLRPFMCVGLAYFAIAVVVPSILMPAFSEPGGWGVGLRNMGVLWSLGGGAAGAFGALGIVYAFNFGGKPIFVMPLVFGCAPVVNTFVTMLSQGTFDQIKPVFLLSLALVITGAVTVLVFAPKPGKPGKPGKQEPSQDSKDSKRQSDSPSPALSGKK